MDMATGKPFERVSLYVQLYEELRKRIGVGVWIEGHYIPNEFALSQEFKVSIGTVRKAVELLVREKLLVRRHGKGTVVAKGQWDELGSKINRLRGEQGEAILSWIIDDIEFRDNFHDRAIAVKLKINFGDDTFIVRRIRKSGTIKIFESMYYPAHVFPNNKYSNTEHCDAIVLALRNGQDIGKIEERLVAVTSSQEISDLMNLPTCSPLLKSERIVVEKRGYPIEYRVAYMHLPEFVFFEALDLP